MHFEATKDCLVYKILKTKNEINTKNIKIANSFYVKNFNFILSFEVVIL